MEITQNKINYKNKVTLNIDIILLGLYFILAPFEVMLRFGSGTLLKYIAGLFVISAGFRIFTSKKGNKIKNPIVLSILFLIIVSYLSLLWTIDFENSLFFNQTNLFLQVLFIFAFMRSYNLKDYAFIKISILTGGIAVFMYLLINGFYQVYDSRAALGESDPNEFAAILILPLFIAFGDFINSRKYIYLFIFFIMFFLILITGSRGALIAVMVALSIYALKNIKYKTIFYGLIIIVIFYFIVLPILPEAVSERLWGEGAYTHDLGARDTRVDIWSTIIENIFPNLSLIGNGTGSGGILLSKYFLRLVGIHNTYLSLIIDYGILGLPVFVYFLYKLYKKINLEKDYAKICSFIAILIIIFFLDAYFKKYLWNVLIYCVISVSTYKTIVLNNNISNSQLIDRHEK